MVESLQTAKEETKEESKEPQEQEGQVAAKHKTLQKEAGEDVELMVNKHTRNVASPFINHQTAWDDEEHFKIPAEIQQGI